MANDGSSDIFPGVPSGTRVNINLKFFMVISAVLCRVKLVVLKKSWKIFGQLFSNLPIETRLLLSCILCHSIFRELNRNCILLVGDMSPKEVVFFLCTIRQKLHVEGFCEAGKTVSNVWTHLGNLDFFPLRMGRHVGDICAVSFRD